MATEIAVTPQEEEDADGVFVAADEILPALGGEFRRAVEARADRAQSPDSS
jgi:hypothetical protein